MEKAMIHYPAIAKQFSMPVLLVNCIGPCDNFVSLGQSAIWTAEGILLKQLGDTVEGLLIFDADTNEVIQHVF